jgi:hypothetical protein
MNSMQSNIAAVAATETTRGVAAADSPVREAMPLLSALAAILQDTIDRFGEVSGKVTEYVMARGDTTDAALIVTLQDFDRLQQEFAALSDVFSHCVEAWCGLAGAEQSARDPIAAITLADLKDRLSNRVRNEKILMAPEAAHRDDDIF